MRQLKVLENGRAMHQANELNDNSGDFAQGWARLHDRCRKRICISVNVKFGFPLDVNLYVILKINIIDTGKLILQ